MTSPSTALRKCSASVISIYSWTTDYLSAALKMLSAGWNARTGTACESIKWLQQHGGGDGSFVRGRAVRRSAAIDLTV